jgi:subtilisin family serine protease
MPDPDTPTTSVPNPPWWSSGQGAQQRKRKRQQVEKIKDAFTDDQVDIRLYPNDADPEGMEFMYEHRTLLTRTSDAAAVLAVLGPDARAERDDTLLELTRITLPDRAEFANIREVITRVEAGTQRSPIVGPDHVVHLCGNSGSCPATEPVPAKAEAPLPARSEPRDPDGTGKDVMVVVVDTGRINEVVKEHNWLTGVVGDPERGSVHHYRGHGTFVAGVIRAIAPEANVRILPLLYRRGAILEGELVRELTAALDFEPDIISMSAGTTSLDVGGAVGLQIFFDKFKARFPDSVVVAAAGNDNCAEHFWPASFDWAVGAGALDSNGLRAGYSNYGDSADVFALGTDHVNAYPKPEYHYEEEPMVGQNAKFTDGMAYWSGTSFATPLVSGLIASQMTSGAGQTAKQAWQTLLVKAQNDKGSLGRPRLFA